MFESTSTGTDRVRLLALAEHVLAATGVTCPASPLGEGGGGGSEICQRELKSSTLLPRSSATLMAR